jgi:hypothetical protein
MAQNKVPEPVRNLFKILADDWKTLDGKYPDQAIFALADKRVSAALETRFDEKASLKGIRPLPYNVGSGLNSIYFEFTSEAKRGEILSPNAFLVLLDGNCKVVAIVDPFDPEQPNAFTPPSFSRGEQPFVLARPSVTEELVFSETDLTAVRMRSREFFMRIGSGGGGDVEVYTTCTYYTSTLLGRDGYNDRTTDDCGLPTILA